MRTLPHGMLTTLAICVVTLTTMMDPITIFIACIKDGVSETQMDNLKDKIYRGVATRTDITRITRRLGDDIGRVYGWTFPQRKSTKKQA